MTEIKNSINETSPRDGQQPGGQFPKGDHPGGQQPGGQHPGIDRTRGRAILSVVMMTSFITTFMGSALNLSVPAISSEFSMGAVNVGWIISVYMLAVAITCVPFGRLADLIGKGKVLIAGEIGFTIASMLCAFAASGGQLILFRLLQGISSAMIFATNTALLSDSFPPHMRGQVLGTSVAAVYTGLSLGPVLGGMLNHNFGWRSIFVFTIICIAITVVVAFKYIPMKSPSGTVFNLETMDLPGCLLYMTMTGALIYGLSSISNGPVPLFILCAGVVLFVLFVLRERRAASPILRISLFTKNRLFALSNLAAMLNYSASYGVTYLLSIYFQQIQGYSSQTAGLILITTPLVQALISPTAGRLSDRVSPRILASTGMALTAAALAILIFISTDTSVGAIVATLLLLGFGFALFSSPNTNSVMSSVSRKDSGIASSVLATARNLGQSFAMSVIAIVVAVTVGNVSLGSVSPDAMISTMRIAFTVMTVLCAAGIWASFSRGEKKAE